jgi:serine/threonine protein kinase
MVTELILGLVAIHGTNLVHRDLKPENIFMTKDNHLKIGLFHAPVARTNRPFLLFLFFDQVTWASRDRLNRRPSTWFLMLERGVHL